MTDKNLDTIVEEIETKISEGSVEDLPEISSAWEAYNIKVMMENTKEWLKTEGVSVLKEAAPVTSAADFSSLERVFLPMVRRTIPSMITPQIVGTQALKQPTGVAFFLRARYNNKTGPEAFALNPPDTTFTGKGSDGIIGSGPATDKEMNPFADSGVGTPRRSGYTTGVGLSVTEAENDIQSHMTVTVEKVSVEAQERQVRATISVEAQQDMKAYHGLNLLQEVDKVLNTETQLETDRQILRTMKIVAKDGAQNTNQAGIFDLNADTDGRWRVEKVKRLIEHCFNEAYGIFQDTRMGSGNFLVVTPKVAAAFAAAGVLDYQGPLNGKTNNFPSDGATFIGTILNKFKVYLDPWPTTAEHIVVGHYGGPLRSGLIYAPYIPLMLVKAVDPASFATALGAKTRYGLVQNPIVRQPNADAPAGEVMYPNNNPFYRIFEVTSI